MEIESEYLYLPDTRRASEIADLLQMFVRERAKKEWTLRAMTFVPEGENRGSIHCVFARKRKGRPRK